MYAKWNDPEIKRIIDAAFPDVTLRKDVLIERFSAGMSLASYWDSGSKHTFRIIDLSTLKTLSVPSNGSGFDQAAYKLNALPVNAVVVQHSRGIYDRFRIHVGEDNAARLLPAPSELSRDEKIVLAATAGLKSSYGGLKNFRFVEANQETGIDESSWNEAKSKLINSGHLRKVGSITTKGRNAIGDVRLFSLRTKR